MCTPPAIYLYTRAFARRSTNLEASRGRETVVQTFRSLNLASNRDHLPSTAPFPPKKSKNLLPNKGEESYTMNYQIEYLVIFFTQTRAASN